MFLHHKTTEREVYNQARTRAGKKDEILPRWYERNKLSSVAFVRYVGLGPLTATASPDTPFDVILYNEDKEVMETTIANIAVETENEETGELEWITPRSSSGMLSFPVYTTVGTQEGTCAIC